jgi:hypothetical protein
MGEHQRKEKDMQNARMCWVVALVLALGRVANGADHTADARERDAAEEAGRDQLHMAVQEICPVTGNRLGDHGTPIKVAVGEHKEEVFLCCEGCARGQIDPRHWATIHANFAKAQRICPVMKHELPENPKWTIVAGQIIYVCCPPCTKKIAANPTVYLRKVNDLYAASLRTARQE